MLEAHEITVKYGARLAVSAVSLKLEPRQVTAIIGPNGAGKSTMLRTLNGGLESASGEILLDGQSLNSYSRLAIAKRIAVVAQEADLRFPVTVFEFVLGGRYAWAGIGGWGWETSHDVEVAHEVLRETQLEELSGRLMNELSGGERQRAVLARALAERWSFLDAVVRGVFTVPGDGAVDFASCLAPLNGYSGWLIVEAEQANDRSSKLERFSKIQQTVSEELPQIYLWYPANVLVARGRVGNIQIEPSGSWFFITKLTLEKT